MSDTAFKTFKWAVRPFIGHGLGSIQPLGTAYQTVARWMIPEQEKVVEINGYKLKARIETGRGIGGIAQKLIFDHQYEPFSTKIFKGLVHEGDTVVDVGANIGYYTLLAASLVGSFGRVVAFEPEEKNYQDLIGNIALNNMGCRVLARKVALSSKQGISVLHVSKDEPGAHSLESCRKSGQEELVETETLDESLNGPVNFIKIDTEGHEISVLAGAKRALTECRNMMIECWEEGLISSGNSIAKMIDMIKEAGFTKIDMIDEFKKEIVPASLCSIRNYSDKHKFSINLICSKE